MSITNNFGGNKPYYSYGITEQNFNLELVHPYEHQILKIEQLEDGKKETALQVILDEKFLNQ
jgi:hypothetical protein